MNHVRIGALCLAFIPGMAFAQAPWRSELYPESWTPPWDKPFETEKLIQDFSYAGYHMGEVELPVISGPVFDVTAYEADPTGKKDSTLAIQKAIDAASAKGAGVVYLPAGTYLVSPQGTNSFVLRISHSNIVLRGAGRDKTFLFNNSYQMRLKSIILAEGDPTRWRDKPTSSPVIAITRDLLTPTISIPVASLAGFKVGDWIMLRADATEEFIAEHRMTDVWGGMGKRLAGVMFQRQIVSVDEKNLRITIDVPIRYYLKTRDKARIYLAAPHLEEVGMEGFSIGNIQHPKVKETEGWGLIDFTKEGNGAYDVHASAAITMNHVRNSWISNIASYHPAENQTAAHILSNGIVIQESRGVTIADCDFERALYGGGGGNGYMFRLQYSNECLVRDSVCHYSRHGFVVAGMASSGNVFLRGTAGHTQVQVAGLGVTAGKGSDHHMYLSQSDLIDSVTLDGDFFDAHYRTSGNTFGTPAHGQTSVHSVYWNLKGLSYHPKHEYIVHSDQARWGYIIGTSGKVSGVATDSLAADKTAPVDFTEGVGKGEALQPQSLYLDQLRRRIDSKKTATP